MDSIIFFFSYTRPFQTWTTFAKLIHFNSLAPGRSGFNLKSAIFNLVLLISISTSSYDNKLRWMSWDLSEGKSTLVQVMAWCRQATSHYLSQCWPRSVSPYGITRAQWVKMLCIMIWFLFHSIGSVICYQYRADSRFAPGQWETALLCNGVSHWLGANLESSLQYTRSVAQELIRMTKSTMWIKSDNSSSPSNKTS